MYRIVLLRYICFMTVHCGFCHFILGRTFLSIILLDFTMRYLAKDLHTHNIDVFCHAVNHTLNGR